MTPLKILLISPGAPYSVVDVFDGLHAALLRAGHQVVEYSLGERIGWAKQFAGYMWEKNGKSAGIPQPNDADAVFLGSRDLPYVAARQRVDAVLVVTGAYVHPDALAILQRMGMPVGVVLTETPYDLLEASILPYVSVAWTNERACVPQLRQANPNVHYLPCGYDPRRHLPKVTVSQGAVYAQDRDTPAHDVVFVGSDFRERVELLLAVDWTGIDLGLYGAWSKESRASKLGGYIKDGVIGNERAASLYRRAKIGLNLYRRAAGAESLNPRAVELAACGVFTISDHRAEVEEVFGELVPMFAGPDQLEAMVSHWLPRRAERYQIERQLHDRVIGRTFDAAATQVAQQLREVI